LVVDFTFQMMSFLPSASATACASMVLPVPGSPLMSSGFCSATAMSTAPISSGEAT